MVKIEDTKQILYALRNKYSPEIGEWAFLEQVGKDISATYNRWCDAIAIGLWKSRGHEIIGFEVKISRNDWLKEKNNPDKAHGVGKYCHKWYLVVGDESIIKPDEIPMNWGLMIPHTKKTFKIKKEAIRNKNPEPINIGFMCAILRRAVEQLLPESRLQSEYRRGHNDGYEQGKDWVKRNLEWKEKQVTGLEKKIENFEKEAGFSITESWKKPEEVGKVLKMILEGNYGRYVERLEDMRTRLKDMAKVMKDEIELHKKLTNGENENRLNKQLQI